MQSFKSAAATPLSNPDLFCHSSFYLRADDVCRRQTQFSDLGELEESALFHQNDAVDLSQSPICNDVKPSNAAVVQSCLQFGGFNSTVGSAEMGSSETGVDTGKLVLHKETTPMVAEGSGNFENWADSGMADNGQQTDTSTDVDTDDKHQLIRVQRGVLVVADSVNQVNGKPEDQKVGSESRSCSKSRMRKKAYVQQLENSRLRLTQLEQELNRARQQGMFIASGLFGDQGNSVGGNGSLAFDMDYAQWLEEHQQLINGLRSAITSLMGDNELRHLVDGVMSHYDVLFRIKSLGAKSDVFHMLSGMWKTPAERCFMWLGGFRSSDLLKILGNHLDPLTDQQLMGICNLQQSSQQAEDALSQGMEALQQSLLETLSSNVPAGSGNVAEYMGQMAIAMGKLGTVENFLHQADLLRQQTLQQMHRILTTRQAARALLVISDYATRLRALSSLWLARPKD